MIYKGWYTSFMCPACDVTAWLGRVTSTQDLGRHLLESYRELVEVEIVESVPYQLF